MEDAAEHAAQLEEQLANLRSVLSAQQAELKRQQHQLSQQQHLQEQLLLLQQHSQHRRHQASVSEGIGAGTVTLLHRSSTSSLVLPANSSLPPSRLSSPAQQPVGCTGTSCTSSPSFQLPSFLTQHVLPFFSMGLPSPLSAALPRADDLSHHSSPELIRAGSGQSHGERRPSLTAVPSTSLPSLFSPSPPPPPSPSSRPPPLCGPLTYPPPPLAVDQEMTPPANSTSRLLLVLRACTDVRSGEATDDVVRLALQQYVVNKLRGHPVLRVISEEGGESGLQSGRVRDGGAITKDEPRTNGGMAKLFRPGRQEKARGPFKYVTISAEADKLLLVLEEIGGLKLLESGVFYAPYRASCRKFFKGGRKDSRLFLSPNEAVELLRLELFAMRFGKDSPFPSLQGLSVMEVCVAAGIVEDLFPLHQLPLLAVLHYKSGCWEQTKSQVSPLRRLGCRKRYAVLKRQDESSEGLTALSAAVSSSASYDFLVAAYFGYPPAAFFLFLRCLRRLLSVLLLVSSSILLFLLCIPSLRRMLHAVVKAEAGPGAAALEAVARSLGEGGGDDGSALRSAVASTTYAASLLSLVAAAGAATADVIFSCIDTPPILNGLLGVGVSGLILWKLTELGNVWPVKPVRKKVQRVLSFASSPSESLEFASHPVFRQAFLGSSSPVRRGAGGGGSRRSSQRSSRYSACCVTAPPTPFLPLSPVGGGGGAGGGGGGGAGGGSRTVTASSCWGGEGGFAEGGGVEFGEERKAHAPQHFTAIPANYAGFGMIETREGAAPVVGSKTTTTTTTT